MLCLLDTFDRLSAKYDEPWTKKRLIKFSKKLPLSSVQIKIKTDNANGLILNGYALKDS